MKTDDTDLVDWLGVAAGVSPEAALLLRRTSFVVYPIVYDHELRPGTLYRELADAGLIVVRWYGRVEITNAGHRHLLTLGAPR